MENPALKLKIRTMDFAEHEVEVAAEASVVTLKEVVFIATGIPADRQRLLIRGTLLKDSQYLEQLGLRDGDIVNLIANPRREEDELDAVSDLARWGVEGLPSSLISRRRRRYARRRELSTSEQLEVIRQNLITLEDLLKIRTLSCADPQRAFDFDQRQLHVGQWVDVKDTVDQWLEAQVIDLRSENCLAFIHYNGWPEHWDEWIQVNSPRIQPLRTHTVQPLTSSMSSPLPSVPPDANGLSEPYTDLDQYLMQSCSLIEQVASLMERFYALNTLLSHDQVEPRMLPTRERLALFKPTRRFSSSLSAISSHATGGSESMMIEPCLDELSQNSPSHMTIEQELNLLSAQLAPILDRTGRLMTDLASVIGNASRQAEDFASVSSSLLTNESGFTVSSRQALQIPVMPGQHELSGLSPGVGSPEMDVHVHLLMSQRGEEERHDPCWRQVS
mmetsp:Transcript_34417/g.60331  ORF Transcript_34417/g.60331 Transcript_34417/m.60331 type:complete len:446 (-) Transcript_34417:4366-5703(-)